MAVIERNEDGDWFKVYAMAADVEGWIPVERLEMTDDFPAADIPASTATPTPTNTPDVRGEYAEMDIRELDAYAANYIGDKVKLRGEVFNIMGGDSLQMWVREPGGGTFDNVAVVVSWASDDILPPEVYEDTWITVYGTVFGTFEGTNAYGGTITQPWIFADIIEKQ